MLRQKPSLVVYRDIRDKLRFHWTPTLNTIYESVELGSPDESTALKEDDFQVGDMVTDDEEGEANYSESLAGGYSESEGMADTASVISSPLLEPEGSSSIAGNKQSSHSRLCRVFRGLVCCIGGHCLCSQGQTRRGYRQIPHLIPRAMHTVWQRRGLLRWRVRGSTFPDDGRCLHTVVLNGPASSVSDSN
ncbi:uncharacterized protein LOC126249676 [Schistocerca nitens]|uniref:uncharacterized protein LOC126249676 n=1 Tax=Schistocerca nitens TaxID=7011 RepID=UPI002117A041|nr:uncharacterized protein LOC126249676 [Schistocerca nitens]